MERDVSAAPGRPIAAVERAMAALETLGHGPAGTVAVARALGVSPSSASRLLSTLEGGGLVAREPGSGRWRLGLGLARLGDAALAGLDLRRLARPLLDALVERTGETATLSLPDGPEAVTADFVASPSSVHSRAQVGRASVAHATSVGRVVLAYVPGALAALPARLERFTAATVTSREQLAALVEDVRAQGYADVAGEREAGLGAIAAPVLDHRGSLAAVLGVQGPERFRPEARAAARGPLIAAAAELAAALGAPASAASGGS